MTLINPHPVYFSKVSFAVFPPGVASNGPDFVLDSIVRENGVSEGKKIAFAKANRA